MSIDIAPDAGRAGRGQAGRHVQGVSLLPLLKDPKAPWRRSILCEYYAENAMPWLVGMSYKAVRTDRYKLIHWVNKDGMPGVTDELYDLKEDPYEMRNLIRAKAMAGTEQRLRKELGRLVAQAVGL
jgi:N-acetylglucosamine-6-sulfatase